MKKKLLFATFRSLARASADPPTASVRMPTTSPGAARRPPAYAQDISPEAEAKRRIAEADAGDPGKYNPRSSFVSNRRASFGFLPQADLLAMTSEGKRKGKRPEQKAAFGGASRRQLALELMGQDASGPGPGAYLPSSTFGKYAKHQSKASKGPSSAFRSRSPELGWKDRFDTAFTGRRSASIALGSVTSRLTSCVAARSSLPLLVLLVASH